MMRTYILKRVRHHLISTGFNVTRVLGAILIYATIGFAQRHEPPVYILFFAIILLQAVAWIYDEVELYRTEHGRPALWKRVVGNR